MEPRKARFVLRRDKILDSSNRNQTCIRFYRRYLQPFDRSPLGNSLSIVRRFAPYLEQDGNRGGTK